MVVRKRHRVVTLSVFPVVFPFGIAAALFVAAGRGGAQSLPSQPPRLPSAAPATHAAAPPQQTITTVFPDGTVSERHTLLPNANFQDALAAVAWDPAARGPLLAVAPAEVRPAWQVQQAHRTFIPGQRNPEPPPPLEPAANGQYRLPDIADYFGRRVVRLNGITVASPGTMVVFNTHPGKPDLYAGLSPQDKLLMLEASLTESQWRALGSEQGIGQGDLTQEQRDLFLSYLPDPFTIQSSHLTPGGYTAILRSEDGPPISLKSAARDGIRLRLNRVAIYRIPFDGHDNVWGGAIDSNTARAADEEIHSLVPSYDPGILDRPYGQQLRSEVPARLKPQQIDFDSAALQAPVALAGAATVGDLVQRIREATRAEIYVDGGMAKKAVWVRAGPADTVRAGELLKALCWGVTGAVRNLGQGVFILTDDIEGYGTRIARLREWLSPLQQASSRRTAKLSDAVRGKQPLQYIGFAAGDPNVPGAELQKQVEDSWKSPVARWQGVTTESATLPASLRETIQKMVAQQSGATATVNGQPATLSTNRVTVTESTRLTYLVPGVGEVLDRTFPFAMDDNLLPRPDLRASLPAGETRPVPADTIAIPATLPLGAVLCVSPTTPEMARATVRAARAHGLRQVWVTVPAPARSDEAAMQAATTAGKALLAAAAAEAARAKPSPSVVCVSPLLTLAPTTDSAPVAVEAPAVPESALDLNILGEPARQSARRSYVAVKDLLTNSDMARFTYEGTRDWLNPTAPGIAARLKRRLLDLTSVPGLAGLALTDAAAPGYGSPDSLPFYSATGNSDLGYTVLRRIAFVRSAGYDPVDIASSLSGSLSVSLPFMEAADGMVLRPAGLPQTQKSARDLWNAARYAVTAAFLADLYKTMTSIPPAGRVAASPLYLQRLDPSSGDWFARWNRADSLPRGMYRGSGFGIQRVPPAQAARSVSDENLLVVPYAKYPRDPDAPKLPGDDLAPSVKLAHLVNVYLGSEKGPWRGVVLDLSQIPCDEALTLLEGAMPARSAAVR